MAEDTPQVTSPDVEVEVETGPVGPDSLTAEEQAALDAEAPQAVEEQPDTPVTAPQPEITEEVGEPTLSPEQQLAVDNAVDAAVAKALASHGVVHQIDKKAQATKRLGKRNMGKLMKFRVSGTYVEAINRHYSNVVNFEDVFTLPERSNMGDVRRSLPAKLAKMFPNFKRLRNVTSFTMVAQAKAGESSDFVEEKEKVTATQPADGEGYSPENVGGVKVGDSTEYGPDGLPPITK